MCGTIRCSIQPLRMLSMSYHLWGTRLCSCFSTDLVAYAYRLSWPAWPVVLYGTPVSRPAAQLMDEFSSADITGTPSNVLCERPDFQLEVGIVIGVPENRQHSCLRESTDHVVYFTLLNNWSAHDAQKCEYVPLRPFSSKNFATTIWLFIGPLEALQPLRIPLPQQFPTPFFIF